MAYKKCECGLLINGDFELCLKCRSEQIKVDCEHYKELEKTITVPFCEFHDKPILSFGYLKCRDCDQRKEIK